MCENQKMMGAFKAGLLISILVWAVYSNTLNSEWHLDDFHNITQNPSVHLTSIDSESIKESIYGSPTTQSLDRPVAYLSFAINWYWGQDDVFGYHIVNIIIHIITATFLFLSIVLLLQTPNLKELDANSIYFVAILSSVLWVIHPIQIQAVTYIVQRMASMAAMFYIIGIFCFLKARLTGSKNHRLFFFLLCGIAFLLGIGTKNNAIMLPIFLILIEFIFFRDLSEKKTLKYAVFITLGATALIGITGFFLFMKGGLDTIFIGYEKRPFTFFERFMTQFRIVVFYISQISYPIASRFSITHDVAYSTSLFTPWTTLPSIGVVFSLIGLAFWRMKKNPAIAFAILFFFGNHLIESSIVPLEMIFEHRNYLPTLFLFFPIALGIKKALDHYCSSKKGMYYFLIFSICGLIFGLSISTYIRNFDWQSQRSLWENAMINAPNSARPLQSLAQGHYERIGQPEKAIELYKKALVLQNEHSQYSFFSLNNIASNYFVSLNDYEKAAKYAQKSIDIAPEILRSKVLLSMSLCMLGRYDHAIEKIDKVLIEHPGHLDFLYLKGFILLKRSQSEEALAYFRKCLDLSPGNWLYLRETGVSLTQMGHYERGYWLLKQANALQPKNREILLGLVDNRILALQPEQAYEWVQELIDVIGLNHIETVLIHIAENPLGLPFSFKNVSHYVAIHLKEYAKTHYETADRLESRFGSMQ